MATPFSSKKVIKIVFLNISLLALILCTKSNVIFILFNSQRSFAVAVVVVVVVVVE